MSSSFGELVLVLGDLHVPERATRIPAAFQRMLVTNKMQHVICTGNVGAEQFHDLSQLAPAFHCVQGDCDDRNEIANNGGGSVSTSDPNVYPNQPPMNSSTVFPETRVVQIGQFRIGVIHGHQLIPWGSKEALDRMRRKLRVDMLITGHTHQSSVVVDEEKDFYHINPGSITGAYSSLTENVIPSFILLAFQDRKVVCYVYELINGEVEVSKTEFTKKIPAHDPILSTNPALLDTLLK